MKIALCVCALFAMASCLPADTYDPKYDSFDAKELAENPRLLKAYGNCFLGKGPCTSEGTDFKKIIPEGVRTNCAKCTPKQRELIRTVVRGFQDKLPDLWDELSRKEDPEGKFKESFQTFLNAAE